MTTKQRFKTSFAENIFRQKYAQNPDDSWDQLCERVVEDVCGSRWGTLPVLMCKDDRDQLVEYMKCMKFLAGGRYLYYAGRPNHYFNNCAGGDTKLLTDNGWVVFKDVVGKTINVLSPIDGEYYPAVMHEHGEQELNEITFVPLRGQSQIEYKVNFTRTHRWPLLDGSDTYDLRVGDVVPANEFSSPESSLGFVHGFMFGDGAANGRLRLCKPKHKYLDKLLSVPHTISYPESNKGDPNISYTNDISWKEFPGTTDAAYVSSFIHGWIAADGCKVANNIHSISKENLEWFRDHAAYAGLVITGDLRKQIRDVKIGDYNYKDHTIYIQNFQYGSSWAGFKVKTIKYVGVQTVYCPFEPVFNRIVIDHNIDTYQCFLLRAEEDTREEWAELAKRSTSCLMTGGGIGVEYSVLRGKGKTISRTGGVSSGPLSLMNMVNEIGRNVMQGGSRRSAIYASLNWQHEDAGDFLVAKNWSQQIRDLKSNDFNFPASLDMTNISLNYDDAWLNNSDRASDTTFLANVRQAMETGEPGFSFNFGSKQNETLRNACTEVTSEDDSDVCNLGSVNMGNIESLEEFKSVVSLASKFLVCGTLRADLPYEKVYKVREKNRRLGLGLMGIHEWLLKRGQGYEVTDELKQWLEVYKDDSERAANDHCDRFFISRPKAFRAIAPTGSIGILAGTTTGIEPLFAVAYKRRYLTDGTKWKYEYVVDSTADLLIKEYGLDPDKIDTAYKLSHNYEQRIKFQYDVQQYVDMSISSTLNLPSWGSKDNNPDCVDKMAQVIAKYAPGLRGMTCYPDGSRGGQPLSECSYKEATSHRGVVYDENADRACKDGVCGI